MENGGHIASADVTSYVMNYSAVPIAYVIDTDQFQKDYGFPFPSVNGLSSNGTITLFVEYSCLSSLDGISEQYDIGEDIPHVTIKTGFMSGEVSQPQYSEPHYYRGLSAADLGVEVNPRLWFKGFRSNIDDELFKSISAVQP